MTIPDFLGAVEKRYGFLTAFMMFATIILLITAVGALAMLILIWVCSLFYDHAWVFCLLGIAFFSYAPIRIFVVPLFTRKK